MARNTEKRGKWEMLTVGPGLWRVNFKTWKTRHKQSMTWNMARNTEKRKKWKKQTLELDHVEKTEKREKREMHTEGPGIWQEN